MAYRPILRRHNVLPIATGIVAASSIFYPLRPVYAESPESEALPLKKPIYDDLTPSDNLPSPAQISSNDTTSHSPASGSGSGSDTSTTDKQPTPTERLSVYVRRARLTLYDVASRSESSFNNLLTEAFHLENSFTSTIASLAPPRTADEALVPGLIYVLVAALAGSIVTRNRGFILRLAVPATFALGMGHAVIPITMQNVGGLVWEYEKKYPPVAETHLAVRERLQTLWETGKSHSAMTVDMAQEKVGDARKGVEDWVKKGN